MKNYKAYSDEGLLKLLRQQELGAFEEIYLRYWKKLYSAAFKRVQSREIAEEIVQDIFTSLWMKREILEIEILSAYLFTAVKYKIINHLEKEMSRKIYSETQLQISKSPFDNSTEETVLLNELNLALEKEIEKLPPKRQQIFKMSRQEHLSIKQVASHLGISEKTAENQLGKALKVLKVNLKHFNFFTITVTLLAC
ncbi:RNA polymerase sigma-70 factor [Chryseolinea sp. H1M3-3]|jgi:RNA polymerase sigma-70 factor (family 1)|uniref:RNA polymerase sigma-70 factor n=1 Tax=Chryseolinea sp. H1M3-3 TaxID=3034144 RepID=UPI0023EB391E|nr:RNA polymerase sigma-70 factor [Chryseolinea sp. H1M3-3]